MERFDNSPYVYRSSNSSESDEEQLPSMFSGLKIVDSSTTSDFTKILSAWMHKIENGHAEEPIPRYSPLPPRTIEIPLQKVIGETIENTHKMKVRSIAFSQSSVSHTFSDGRLLKDTTAQLNCGKLSPQKIPPIRVVKFNNKWITLDNRRLRVFWDALVDEIPVIQCSLSTPDIAQEFWTKKSNKSAVQGGSIRTNSTTTSKQHFDEGIFVFNKRILNWNLHQVQKSMLSEKEKKLPKFFTSRKDYYESFQGLIFEEARAILQSGSEQSTLDQAPLLTLSVLKKFKSPKNPQNPAEMLFKIVTNEGQELRAGEAFLLVHSEHHELQLIGISNYSELGPNDLQFSLKVVVDQDHLQQFFKAFESDQKWSAKSIGSLITLQRMFDSCSSFGSRKELLLEKMIWSGGKISPLPHSSVYLSEEEEQLLASLNSSQYEPIKEFLNMKEGLQMIQGPPGTGKTTTVSKLLIALEKRGERILVCASSNKGAQTLAEICLRKCRDVPMILIGVEKKLPADGALHPIFFDLWGERQIQTLNDLSQDLWKLQMTEIVKGHSKFLRQRVHTACEALKEKKNKFSTFVREVTPYHLDCFEGLAHIYEEFEESVDAYCDFISCQEDERWKAIVSYQNDNILMEMLEFAPEEVKVSRQFLSNLATLLSSLLMKVEIAAADESKNGLEMQLLNHSRIIFSTLSTSGQQRLKSMESVDSLIIDEAGQSLEIETTIPFRTEPKKCLLVGDIEQLPATVISRQAEKLKFGRSMMQRLSRDCNVSYSMLKVQYRMHPEICAFPSHLFYHGLLENHPSVEAAPLTLHNFLAPYAFIDIQGQERKGTHGHSYINELEVKSIQTIVNYLQGQKIDVAKQVGVITFYKAQCDLIHETLKAKFPGIIVNTVDGFQGGECDFIIISCVRANTHNQIGFLDEYRRLNVALTRAKRSLIILGNAMSLNHGNLGLLVANARERKVFYQSNVLQQLIPKKNVKYQKRPKSSKPTQTIQTHHNQKQVSNQRKKTPIVGIQPSNANYKTELCRHFTRPSGCWQGNQCKFAHGKKDLF